MSSQDHSFSTQTPRLIVIGGVAAGASLAARARRLSESAHITVLERGEYVSFANCGLPYHIGGVIPDRERLLVQTPQSLQELLNLDVRVGTEVIAIDRHRQEVTVRELASGAQETLPYDALAVCTGSQPVQLPIVGMDLPQVMVLRDIMDMDAIKAQVDQLTSRISPARPARAVVIGAGYVGLEMVENLSHRGMDVSLVEAADQILPIVDLEIAQPVTEHLEARGVDIYLGSGAAAIVGAPSETLEVELTTGVTINTDLVIMSVGVRPVSALASDAGLEVGSGGGIIVDEHMRTSDPHIWAAGDVVETSHAVLPRSQVYALAGPANRQGRIAADNIFGRRTRYKSTLATSIVKAFDMAVGSVGATESQLHNAGMEYRAIHIHPADHAGYYPDATTMHLKLLFNPTTGTILGGQVCGFGGVDKRLDVIALAIKGHMTVFDLEEAEFAYAPPYGSAKDPINMAGFVAANTIRGDVDLWYAHEYSNGIDQTQIIDVRTPNEYEIWHLPGAHNVPLSQLRECLEDWDRSRPVRLYCGVGFRSYLAYRILVQNGFADVKTLSGGAMTFKAFHRIARHSSFDQQPEVTYSQQDSREENATDSAQKIDLDCRGLACPGPIMRLAETIDKLESGDQVTIRVSDTGFGQDATAWAQARGHSLISLEPEGAGFRAVFRKGGMPKHRALSQVRDGVSFVVFSGDLDKLMAAFIIANGALAMGKNVSMFFTFWGLNALRRADAPYRDKPIMERMMAAMMPNGAEHLTLSQMHMAGAGTAMMKKIMRDNHVATVPELIESALGSGAQLIACTMTMDLLGIAESDLREGISFGGVASFLGAADQSGATLFI